MCNHCVQLWIQWLLMPDPVIWILYIHNTWLTMALIYPIDPSMWYTYGILVFLGQYHTILMLVFPYLIVLPSILAIHLLGIVMHSVCPPSSSFPIWSKSLESTNDQNWSIQVHWAIVVSLVWISQMWISLLITPWRIQFTVVDPILVTYSGYWMQSSRDPWTIPPEWINLDWVWWLW